MAATMRRVWLLLMLALAGCANNAPTFDEVEPTLPRPPGTARFIIYRNFEPNQSLSWVPVFIDRATVGAVGPGFVIVRDMPPGTYTLEAKSQGLWPGQAQTVTVEAGQTVYAKITSFRSRNPSSIGGTLQTTFVLNFVDPALARQEIGRLWYEATARLRALAG